ncbi:MAG: hypothetical protein LBM75_04025 [Myxococcales bacterium]|jgi:hypothetical protein|nr:hypothetical protein [Myxococcales bacterium]
MKRSIFMSSLLAALCVGGLACSDNKDDEKECAVEKSVTCEGKCGTVTDTCGIEQDCGTDCGEGKACNTSTNTCEESGCAVEKSVTCEGKCGTVTDTCGIEQDCGTDCGEGTFCNTMKQECEPNREPTSCWDNNDCATDEFCDQTTCTDLSCQCNVGPRGTKACGEAVEVNANECAYPMAIDVGETSYCTCECEAPSDCPSNLPDCSGFFGVCND